MASVNFEPGQTVSHFRIEKLLGEGGMGAVYLAEDLTLSRRVAIKFMHRSLLVQQTTEAAREGLEKRFIREAKSAAAINHPNLAQIYEANFDSDNWFIAMEYIDGSSLYDLISEGKKFSVKEIVNICRQVVSGLEFAWDNYKIVHRDVKPHNIMLTKNNLVKIVDLGLAKPLAGEGTEYGLPELTCAGTPIGTPQYMAPEQATGQKDINFLVDIFALGASLYEVLTGDKAFRGNTAPMIYMAQVQKKYIPLDDVKKNLPGALVNLIHSMLEPKPEDRISSYRGILEVLNHIEIDPDADRPRSAMTKGVGRPVSGIHGQLSSKTIGMDQLSVYHPTDMLIKDRYRILKRLGKSRAGIVYHCMDTQLGVECVVKSIFPGREYPEHDMPSVIANFQKLMSFSHPSLVQIRDLQLDDETGELFVVMELLLGRNLREYTHQLRNQTNEISMNTILPVLTLVAKALDNVGKTFNVIHYDLIPEKIYLLKNNTQVKLLDYGITYPSSDSPQGIKPEDYFKYPLSTPDYMSPELWERKLASRQSDQYSLAVILYEMLAEKLPFWLKDPILNNTISGETDDQLLLHEQQLRNLYNRVLSEPPSPLSFLKRHENHALLKALSKDPHNRFPSCEEFIDALAKSGTLSEGVKLSLISAAALLVLATAAYLLFAPGPEGVPENITDISPSPPVSDTSDTVQQKIDASKLKTKCNDIRASILRSALESNIVAQFDSIVKAADASFANGNYQDAIDRYKNGIAFGTKLLKEKREAPITHSTKPKNDAIVLKNQLESLRETYVKDGSLASPLPELDTAVEQANKLFDKGEYAQAISRYKNAIQLVKKLNTHSTDTTEVKNSLKRLRQEFLRDDNLALRVPEFDEMMEPANALFDKGKYELAAEAYEQALDWGKNTKNQKEEASNLKLTFEVLSQEFSEDDILAARLSELDEVKKHASELFDSGDYLNAIGEYKRAIDSGRDIEDQVKQERKAKAIAAEKEAETLRGQLKKYKRLSTKITEKVVKVDVTLSLARESLEKEDFKVALEHYTKAIIDSKAILDLAVGKFQAKKGKNFTDPKVGMELVWVPSLELWAGKHEVTNREYRKFKKTHDSKKSMGFSLNRDQQPAIEVSYYDAVAFCEWMNAVSLKEIKAPSGYEYRLPSREEWEAIARCGKERLYPWGNEWPPKYGNFGNQEVFPSAWDLDGYSDEFPVTCDVGKSGVNEWGLYGVAGNVWEWTTGIKNDKRTVLGGAWTEVKRTALVLSLQAAAEMDQPYDNIGFRVFLAPKDD